MQHAIEDFRREMAVSMPHNLDEPHMLRLL
jgi:hypothetical protein